MQIKELSRSTIAISVLFIFYTVGIIGISLTPYSDLFLSLSPFNLLLTLGLLIWANDDRSTSFFTAFVIIFQIGFFVEVAGVQTGLIFGEYSYGPPLGFQLWETPLMIGVNWFLLSFASFGVVKHFLKSNNYLITIISAAALTLLLDFPIEPVAIKLDFWTWAHESIPTQNYVAWFLIALVIQSVLYIFIKKVNYKICLAIYLVQLMFFGLLNFLL